MSNIELKEKKVEYLVENISNSRGLIIADYSGLSVTELSELRGNLREVGSFATVFKNGVTRRALGKLNRNYPEELLKGPNIIVYSETDAVGMSKKVVDFSKNNEKLTIKGGFLSEDYIDIKMIDQLAKLPSREELIAKAIGLIKSPITGLVMSLSSPVNGLVNVLNNIKSKKQ